MITILAVPGVVLVGRAAQYAEQGFVYASFTLAAVGAMAAVMGVLLTRNNSTPRSGSSRPRKKILS